LTPTALLGSTFTPSLTPSPTVEPTTTPTPVAPTPDPTSTPTPTGTPLPQGWYVQNETATWTGANDVYVIGEVLNNTGGNQEDVDLVITFFDGTGQQIGEAIASPVIDVLPQGVIAPFEVAERLTMGFTRYEVEVEAKPTVRQPRQDLDLISHSGTPGNPYRIAGEIGNPGQALDEYVQVIATLYGDGGNVVGLGYDFISPDDLGVGQMARFEVVVDDALPGIAHYTLLVLGF
jgi:hypothetical protein